MDLIMTSIGKVEAVRSCSVSRFVPHLRACVGPHGPSGIPRPYADARRSIALGFPCGGFEYVY